MVVAKTSKAKKCTLTDKRPTTDVQGAPGKKTKNKATPRHDWTLEAIIARHDRVGLQRLPPDQRKRYLLHVLFEEELSELSDEDGVPPRYHDAIRPRASLTPPLNSSEPVKRRRNRTPKDMTKPSEMKKAAEREIKKMVEEARVNTTTFPVTFKALAKHKKLPALIKRAWLSDVARMAVDKDGKLLLLFLPKMQRGHAVDSINNSVEEFASVVNPKVGQNASKSGYYIDGGDSTNLQGDVAVVTSWYGLGQEHKQKTPVPCKDILKKGKHFSAACKLIKALQPLSYRVNAVVEEVDPPLAKALKTLRGKLNQKYAFMQAFSAIDPLLFEGRELLFNRVTDFHWDSHDPKQGAVAMYVGGNCKGGVLEIKELGLKVRMEPGDLIYIRGRVLKHATTEFCGQRIVIPHFTHTDLWRAHNLAHLVDKFDTC